MAVASADEQIASGQYRINDVKGVLIHLALAAFALFLAVLFGGPYWIFKAALAVVGVSLLFRTYIYGKGYVFDFDENTIEFPGGGISPNSFGDIFLPKFFLQYFKRFTINLSDIRQISSGSTRHRSKDGTISYSYWLKINGSFGAAKLVVGDEGKRDEIYSAILVTNQMGEPVRVQG